MDNLIIALLGGTILLLASPYLHLFPGHHLLAGGAAPDKVKRFVQVFLTILIAPVCLYVIFAGSFGADEKKWAAGFLGTIVGFWFGK